MVARLVLQLPGKPGPDFIEYNDIVAMKADLVKVIDGTGWVQLRAGRVPSHEFVEEVRASTVIWCRMEIF